MIGSPNALATLVGLQDSAARLAGFGVFSDLHADRQSILNGWLEMAMMELAGEGAWAYERSDEAVALNALAPYSTGTVAINVGSSTVTGTTTDWVQTPAILVADRSAITFGAETSFYMLDAIGSDTSATILGTYGGPSNLTAATYEIGTPDYALTADVWGLREIREIQPGGQRLTLETYEHWLDRTGGIWTTGRPTHAVLLGGQGDNAGANFAIRLWPCPDDTYRYVYSYLRIPTWPTTNLNQGPVVSNALLYKTLELAKDHAGDHDSALAWMKKYDRAVAKLKTKNVTRGPVRRRMEPAWGSPVDLGDLRIIDDPTGTVN